MKRSAIARLTDILTMSDAAADIVAGRTFADCRRDLVMRLAVERRVEIVSEASRHVPPDAKTHFPAVTRSEIAAVGNKLRHEYNRIDDLILWKIATASLPELRPIIAAILSEASAG
ncbi:HepT-like ribonuclease domain-containing protein [Methylobacterium sp. WL120]|uniref:HepT-like ribonuclease domain-containing protein n=1 Tax=Methylobacterium sp. WL120 TaxID=2603887 RepID=UPI0011CC3088|nr:HepT-like ribonuclease domain-containing protein [Methylobacterium sp. WL120]TXM67368.1 DUF86 domain-containing protein [Methylobacterium sp. WL120]